MSKWENFIEEGGLDQKLQGNAKVGNQRQEWGTFLSTPGH